jgi:4-hydroxy-3-polyprenylbenzoate decarboxylase
MDNEYDGLRNYIDACRGIGEVVDIDDADWDLEIGTLSEAAAEKIIEPPMMLFDKIKGYPKGFRVLSLPLASKKRTALVFGLSPEQTKLQLAREISKKIKNANPIPPEYVKTGPVMENVMTGDTIDLWKFPVLRSHAKDGGRYIGTADQVINRDPESGFVNMATYRIQVHERNLLGLWMSPGQHGRTICQRYWDKGQACPIIAVFGGDPLVFNASSTKLPWGTSEFDLVGGLRGKALPVIKGPLTGLPMPAHAEIVIEGEVPPPSEQNHEEGPFGEWPGYYSGGTLGTGENQPVIRVKAIYYRNDPIIVNMAPQWPGAPHHSVRFDSGVLWDQLESAGVPGIAGVYIYNYYLMVVAIKQQYVGHAKQTAHAVLGCSASARNGRYTVIVDDDIDPTNIQEVLWAMETRVDPASDIEIVDDCWSTPLDPRMPPEKRDAGIHTNSRAIFYAVRPYQWKDRFPMVNRADREDIRKVMDKFRGILPFPKE